MAGEWPVKTIAECASAEPYSTQIGPFGKALMADEYTEPGVPVLRGMNVNRGRFHDDDFVFIDDEAADRLHKFESYPGDVLLVHKGTLGQIGLMPSKRRYERYIMGNSMMRVRCDPAKLLPEYLYYWLSSADGQHYLFSRISQVGVPQIQTPLTTLRQATLPVPPLDEQRAIAYILSSLDDKIELNRRMNETLEAIARALFKSWFVDFDPVRANAQGRDTSLPSDITALFPTSLERDDQGDIPAGWRRVPLGDPATFPLVPPGIEMSPDIRYYIATGDVDRATILDEASVPVESRPSRANMQPGYGRVWFAKMKDSPKFLWTLRDHEDWWSERILSTGFAGVSANSAEYESLLYCFVSSAAFDDAKNALATGTTMQAVNNASLRKIKLVVPPQKLAEVFDQLVRPLYVRTWHNYLMNRTLIAARAALLPKLVSGELRAPQAARMLGASTV